MKTVVEVTAQDLRQLKSQAIKEFTSSAIPGTARLDADEIASLALLKAAINLLAKTGIQIELKLI